MSEVQSYDFKSCLRDSMEPSYLKWLDEEYKKSFSFNGKLIHIERVDDNEMQKNGIDALIYFDDGMVFTVQEKKSPKKYDNILLELEDYDKYSDEHIRDGWLYTRQSDFLAYSRYVPEKDYKVLYIFPFAIVKSAWQRNEKHWKDKACKRKEGFQFTYADNVRNGQYQYTTKCIAIPTNELINSVRLLSYYTPICGKVTEET